MTAPTTVRSTLAPHVCPDACVHATSHISLCTCLCMGANHGTHGAGRANQPARPRRDPFAGLPAVNDFNLTDWGF